MRENATAKKPVSLRTLAVRALRRERFGVLCKDERRDYANGSEFLSIALALAVATSLSFYAGFFLGWGIWRGLVAVCFALLFGLIGIHMGLLNAISVYLAMMALSFAGLLFLLLTDRGQVAVATHGLPVALIFTAVWGFRALRLLTAIPFFIPVALIIVLAPLLTEDPWRLAYEAQGRLGWLAGVSIIPVLKLPVLG